MSFSSARKRAGLSQAEVARRLDVTRASVNLWERGRGYPVVTRLLEVAQLLDCSVEEILRRDESAEG